MKRLLPIAMILALAAPAARCIRNVAARQPEGQCAVHNMRLRANVVSLTYGLPSSPSEEYLAAAQTQFPNAFLSANGGCVVNPFYRWAWVRACPACNAAEKEWLASHSQYGGQVDSAAARHVDVASDAVSLPLSQTSDHPEADPVCSFSDSLLPSDILIGYIGDIRPTGTVRVGSFRPLGILRNNALAVSDGATIRNGMEFWQVLEATAPPTALKNVSAFFDRLRDSHCVFHADLEDDLPLWTLLASRPLPSRTFRRPDVSDDIYFAEHHNACIDQGDEPSEEPPCSRPRLLAVSDLNHDGAAEYWATEPYLWDTGITVWQRTETGLSEILVVCTGCSD